MSKRKSFSGLNAFLVAVICLVLGFVVGFIGFSYLNPPRASDVYVSGDLSIHFMELGNNYTGDSIYIKAGETDILVDAGSRASSVNTIGAYLSNYVTDNKLEYVIATHADQDHIAGFAGNNTYQSIFELYECETIIDFALTNKDTVTYNNYIEQRDAEVANGATHYTALQCWNNADGASRTIQLSDGIELEILYNYFYENNSSDENNYSVCFMINQGDKHFLFTGDLEEEGEEYLVEYNNLPEVELYKAGHHGSKTSSNEILLSVIKPKIVCVCCCAGSVEYSGKSDTSEITDISEYKDFMKNTFPTQDFIDRVSTYTSQVYVTTVGKVVYDTTDGKYKDDGFESLNGNIVVTSSKSGVEVNCSNNNTLLKDTDWFANNRVLPQAWAV